jgi:lipopolysaccharide export system permease protein
MKRSGPIVTRIDRYIFRQLFWALIAVTAGLSLLIWLTQSLRFVELVVNHGLSFGVFLELTGLLIPSFVAVILPITTFVVVQFVYQRLAGDRELTVMRAAGLSQMSLSRPGLAVGVVAVIFCYFLNIWVVPASLTRFREFQFEIRNRMAAFMLQEGVFTSISDDLTVYVRYRDPDGVLRGLLVDDARQPNSHATILAESGRIADSPTGPRVILFNGSRQELDRQTGRLNVLTFGENVLDLQQASKNESDRLRDMSEVSVHDLLHPTPAMLPNARDIPKWHAEAHKRLASPLTAGSFALLALYSVLGEAFRRHGGFARPFLAVLTVVALLAAGLAIGNLAARNNALVPLIWVHAIGPGIACAWLLLGPSFRRRTRLSVARLVSAERSA